MTVSLLHSDGLHSNEIPNPLGFGELRQLCDSTMSIWTKIHEECFQQLAESMLQKPKTIMKAKKNNNNVNMSV